MRREIPPMQYRELGRTGLMVSALSLGSGGVNGLGQRSFRLPQHIVDLIRNALDIGINLFDTAPSYGESEAVLGEALKNIPREKFIIATKIHPVAQGRISGPRETVGSLERSLKKLRVDTVDILQFHAVLPDTYRAVVDSLMPTLEKLRDEGKFRFLGITESSIRDRAHEMLTIALSDDIFDTVMVALNPAYPAPGNGVLRTAGEKKVGVICMAAARSAALLQNDVGNLMPGRDRPNGQEFSRQARAYGFAVSHPAVSTVLTGTTNVEHLRQNAHAVLGAHRQGDVRRSGGGV